MNAIIEYERYEARLSDGTTVLGKCTEHGVSAKTYANRTQANKAASRENGEVIQRGRPFYVRIKHTA